MSSKVRIEKFHFDKHFSFLLDFAKRKDRAQASKLYAYLHVP